ncbi:pectinesterase inhibitor 10-like [Vigna umbellata]|uniref:pectinesterase inhibitor 10-like n=1 Tax=Vigna umbellata TaxID=87088 RepID=UPI001F5F7D19|nr:pectinesterase inhibitor 10-like [Vigna umbellata]
MASSASSPPLPPSGKSDKGKGKKSYVMKLMTCFNNEIGSSSQPTTPTSTSTGRSIPPSLVVPGLTHTPHQVPTSTPTSIGRSIPPSLVVPGLTPTPHQVPTSTPTSIGTSLPPPLQVSGLTPTPYQVPTNRMASLSPNVGSNPSTPTNIAPSPGIEDADQYSSSTANYVEKCSNSRPIITPVGGGFYPTKTASNAITTTIKQ